jgi:pimeloyl-ACP methyl ester carboxylesterase/DNA-binding CsgD family transcriptional regulator
MQVWKLVKMTPIHFCKSFDGARIASASSGRGPAMVEVATWLNHLEHDWKSPVWGPRLAELSDHYSLTRYDSRGCGLSDRNLKDLTFDACLRDLEAVVDAAELQHFILLGCCQGSGLAIAYAARHPKRVSHLILYGAFARGRMKRAPSLRDIDEANIMLKLVELGWGQGNSAFRQVFTTMFIPDSTPEQYHWFNELQQMSTSPENAVGLTRGFDSMDVSGQLADIRSSTLVLHARGDSRVPFAEGHIVANSIPDAEFVPLEGRNHILLEHQPAWRQFFVEIARFVRARATSLDGVETQLLELTTREREVLDHIARGLDNEHIAKHLSVSSKTVRNHINSIFGKLGTPNRAQAIVLAREAGLGRKPSERAI